MWNEGEEEGEGEEYLQDISGKPEGNRQLGRPRCRWVNKTKMDLGELVCRLDCSDSVQGLEEGSGNLCVP
jgi:hypothetical protein